MPVLPMNTDILPPSDDRVFKLLLVSPEAKPALMDLISAIIYAISTPLKVPKGNPMINWRGHIK